METIKFSHPYRKLLHDGRIIREALLLDVIVLRVESLSAAFRKIDTWYGIDEHYNLPESGPVMLLIFQKPMSGQGIDLFTTVRSWTTSKEAFYRSKIGEALGVWMTAT